MLTYRSIDLAGGNSERDNIYHPYINNRLCICDNHQLLSTCPSGRINFPCFCLSMINPFASSLLRGDDGCGGGGWCEGAAGGGGHLGQGPS